MRLEHFDEKQRGPELLNIARKVEKSSNDILESEKAGFAFPVPEEVRAMDSSETLDAGNGAKINKLELFKTVLHALKEAWEKEIEPRLSSIRNKPPEDAKQKEGTDFFTEADTKSEQVIRERFMHAFGADTLRIFGEEANKYLGNLDSHIGVRIDPVDGTEAMKFGKPDWGIMVGVYVGMPESERQVMGAIYYPERNLLVYNIDGVGTFVSDTELAETNKVAPVQKQDDLGNIIVPIWEHSDLKQRGNNELIKRKLVEHGGRIRSTQSVCSDTLEALLTKGGRAMIIDGDYNQVDFIPLSFLEKVGYMLYKWDGTPVRADDINLKNEKVLVLPPGKAGEQIRAIVTKLHRGTIE